MKKLMILTGLIFLLGCQSDDNTDKPLQPLTRAEWSEMDEGSKYQMETLKRLKESVPEFHDDIEWQHFLIEEVGPKMNNT